MRLQHFLDIVNNKETLDGFEENIKNFLLEKEVIYETPFDGYYSIILGKGNLDLTLEEIADKINEDLQNEI